MYCIETIKLTSYTPLLIPTKAADVVLNFCPSGSFVILKTITQKTDLITALAHTRAGIYYRVFLNNCNPNAIQCSSLRQTTWHS